ncbi:MAG: thymidine kinase [Proteobacteria bacterium]|jgi:thymidine kinase|nr:thymidine kinase [Pseudomonadota bacterium]MDA1301784.1 thymidine kinase [Pseudomonadota bacterium]
MAKLFFYYSSMNAGKSTALLQSSYNYRERGMRTCLLVPAIDDRYAPGTVTSRIGLSEEAEVFDTNTDLYTLVSTGHATGKLSCVMVDEAQFLTRDQVLSLCRVVDALDLPVLCYGLRTDFRGEPFEGSLYLLAWADNLREIKAICHCGRKATMVLRVDQAGEIIREGAQVEIGGNDRYVSVCRRHFMAKFFGSAKPSA